MGMTTPSVGTGEHPVDVEHPLTLSSLSLLQYSHGVQRCLIAMPKIENTVNSVKIGLIVIHNLTTIYFLCHKSLILFPDFSSVMSVM